MRIILTHEQADFDALASQLAAALLDEAASLVLPNRMNRNVRAFLTIYGAELPFLEQRDLPGGIAIKSVCLVDTQSMITVRGIGPSTPVHVIDHHPQREDMPSSWTFRIDEVGATTTLLVEALQEHNGHLNLVQATLLLLGIYEDTGSLTYSHTTARDLQAAAYLLEQGASLRIANDFLNHPLSPAQQQIYDQLRQDAQVFHVHGHTIIAAQGNAVGIQEELSTIAHKLRDLLDPDALFLVLETHSGIQLIARSTSEHIDVAAVAAHFGGGGHERAAAALIRERSLAEAWQDLVAHLPEFVHPAVTVAEIMSGQPQLLAPETPVGEVLERMQRFGYEGYPVVDQGRVVGLLTRRAVDRAVSHKLNLTASSLMNAGEVLVAPDDSIEHLQRLMTDSGWGQVPVVNPETGAIIGIVTRTDLLKTLAQNKQRRTSSLADRLVEALPPERLALLRTVAATAHAQHIAVYVVGGFVRDLLLGHPSMDFDIVVEGDAIALGRSLANRYGGRITMHTRFGTAKWYLANNYTLLNGKLRLGAASHKSEQADVRPADRLPPFVDLISARTEFYPEPTALPTVERGSIKLDLHRRDFTINTLALRLDGSHFGELHDYWGGLNDLHQELVRVLHSLSFIDDPTRMLRAVRYEQRYGFQIESRTLALLQEALPLIARVTGERLRAELEHILDEPQCPAMLTRLNELGLLQAIHPDLALDDAVLSRLAAIPQEEPDPVWGLRKSARHGWATQKRLLAMMAWLMPLSVERAQEILARLATPRGEGQTILDACRLYATISDLIQRQTVELVEALDDYDLLVIYAGSLLAPDARCREALAAYLLHMRYVHPNITGDELRRRGVPPSPVYKQILRALRNAWLEGQVTDEDQELALLENLLQGFPLKKQAKD